MQTFPAVQVRAVLGRGFKGRVRWSVSDESEPRRSARNPAVGYVVFSTEFPSV